MADLERKPNVFVLSDDPIYSLSPAIQNAAFRAEERDDDFFYGAVKIPTSYPGMSQQEMMALFLQEKLEEGVRGISVTIPFKSTVLESGLVTSSDHATTTMGVCNTVFNSDGQWLGFNTDWLGLKHSLEAMDISIAGKKVILYGAGGMGRGCSYALGQEVAREVVVLNRTPDRAEALASDSQALWPDTEFRSLQPVEESLAVGLERELATTDIFINASSVGQKGKGAADKSPLAGLNFRDLVVVESVYDPGTTPLVEQAYASECCPVIKGLDILIHQAIEQVYIYLGYSDQARANMPPSDRRALAKVMRHASRLELYEREQAKTPRGKVIAWEPHTT